MSLVIVLRDGHIVDRLVIGVVIIIQGQGATVTRSRH